MMDVDHEAHKHDVPKSTVEGEAERAAAEDPSEQIQAVLDDAKDSVDEDGSAGRPRPAERDGTDARRARPSRDDAARDANRSEQRG